jgi:hypothetical protein
MRSTPAAEYFLDLEGAIIQALNAERHVMIHRLLRFTVNFGFALHIVLTLRAQDGATSAPTARGGSEKKNYLVA